jgi:hypothetical protein
MSVVVAVFSGLALALAALDAYQAITGTRVSKQPSWRSDEQMRRQSAIAAGVLGILGVVGLILSLGS